MATKKQATPAIRPTGLVYAGLDLAFEHFNRELFGGSLPPCLITMQRHAHSYGYFSGGRFARAHKGDGKTLVDEIAINPQHVAERTPDKVLSTLVHEQAHSWQHHHGKEPTRCYHDRQWAAKMKEIGLHPSSTGEPGGKETGPKVSHYIIGGGPFAKACAAFLKKNEVALYQDRAMAMAAIRLKRKTKEGDDEEGGEDETPKSPGRIKFCCKGCDLNAWAKPSAKLRCDDCDRPMHAVEKEDGNGDD